MDDSTLMSDHEIQSLNTIVKEKIDRSIVIPCVCEIQLRRVVLKVGRLWPCTAPPQDERC